MGNAKFYLKSNTEVCNFWQADIENGLTSKEAGNRLKKFGLNEIKEVKKIPVWKKFISQFRDFMVLVLLGATLISGLLGEYVDAITILTIVVFNAILGFIQEYRAEQSMHALKKLSAPSANVLRNGCCQKIEARKIVPGDLLMLESGDKVPADCRIIHTESLEIEESMLTGESLTVKKGIEKITEEKSAIGDRINMAYAGTIVVNGRGKAIACATGMYTEMGKIADLLQTTTKTQTPLEKRLEDLGKKIVVWCLIICSLVVIMGVIKGEPLLLMCMAGISLAVAAIPEGLPAIVTVALALGVQRMIKRNAIIRKLPAVETLGCINVICSDKTGTLTKNQMTVKKVFICNHTYDITGDGYEIKGKFISNDLRSIPEDDELLKECLKISVLCNNSELKRNDIHILGAWRKKETDWSIAGDPTEGAMIVAAAKLNIWRNILEEKYKRVREIPFDSMRSMMSVICKNENMYLIFTKGAPDEVIKHCNRIYTSSGIQSLDRHYSDRVVEANEKMGNQALRVLAVAYKPLNDEDEDKSKEALEHNLIFVGLIGMIDPPREEARAAIETCHQAGIKTVMITGDHPNTAMAIASELKIYNSKKHKILTGNDLDHLDEKEFGKIIGDVRIFARVSPIHKLKIVKSLQKNGCVVAMTGDGVNDAPAIKEADIGIAMGINGTDVAKEASSMVLTDDNFSTIVAAVEEGRSIYENIRKFIRYLLACNTGEILTMFITALISLPMPLLPVQILWVNLVTDGLPAMALGIDPNDRNIMQRPPRKTNEGVFSKGLSKKIIFRGVQIGLSTIFVFTVILFSRHDLELARTMAFTTLVLSQIFHVFDCRSEHLNAIEAGLFKNKYLVGAVLCSIVMQMLVIYHPFLSNIFSTVPLQLVDWLFIICICGWNFMLNVFKFIFFPRKVAHKVFSK